MEVKKNVCVSIYTYVYISTYKHVYICICAMLEREWRLHGDGAVSHQEEIFHVQCQRNPSKRVSTGRGHQRASRLKPESQKNNQSNTWTTALSNSMKLRAMLCRATKDGQVMVEVLIK